MFSLFCRSWLIITEKRKTKKTNLAQPQWIRANTLIDQCTVPLKWKLPPLVSFLARRDSRLSRWESRLARINEAEILAYIRANYLKTKHRLKRFWNTAFERHRKTLISRCVSHRGQSFAHACCMCERKHVA